MIYYPNIKTLFLASIGTGSHSINRFLSKVNNEQLNEPVEYNTDITIPEVVYENIVVSIANPYARVAFKWNRRSEWLTKVGRASEIVSFADFVKNANYKLTPEIACISTTLANNNITPTTIVRLESIKSDIKLVPGVNIGTNKAHRDAFATYIANDGAVTKKTQDWKKLYSQELADLVHKELESDFTAYKYSKISWS